jgi:hypothetical protein
MVKGREGCREGWSESKVRGWNAQHKQHDVGTKRSHDRKSVGEGKYKEKID